MKTVADFFLPLFKRHWAIATILLATIIIYFPIRLASFVTWDDPVLIIDNPILKLPLWPALRLMFGQFIHGDYLPLTMLSYWFQINLFSLSSQGMHVVNLLLHCLNIYLLWQLLERFKINKHAIAMSVLLFALHPVQVESVAWVSEHKGLLASFFLIIAVNLFVCGSRRFSLMFFIVSLLCKGLGLMLPLVGLIWMLLRERHWKKPLMAAAPFILVSVVYGLARILAYQQNLAVSKMDFFGHLGQLPILWCQAVVAYTQMFFAPFNLAIIYQLPATHFWQIGLALLIVSGLAVAAFKDRQMRYLILALVFLMLPIMHVVARVNFVNDRYLYLATPLIALISLGYLAKGLTARLFWPLLLLLGIGIGFLTQEQLPRWSNSRSLWAATAQQLPAHPMVLNNLGLAYQESGDWKMALEYFQRSVEFDRQGVYRHLALNNLGTIYSTEQSGFKDLYKAHESFKQSIQYSHRPVESILSKFNLALVELQLQRNSEAKTLLQEIIVVAENSNDQHLHYFYQRSKELIAKIAP